MPDFNAIIDNVLQLLTPFTEVTGWLQLLVLLLAALTSSMIVRFLAAPIEQARANHTGLWRTAMGSSARLLYPLTFVLVATVGLAILKAMGIQAVLLRISISLMLSLAAIRLLVYLLRRGFAPSPTLKTWENTLSTLIWMGVALHLLGWLHPLLQGLDSIALNTGSMRISILSVLKFVLSIGFFLLLAIWLSALVDKQLQGARNLNSGLKVGLSKGIRTLLIIMAFLIALNAIGIDLTALAVFGGALGVGLGFGLQRIASNFISGFILLFDRSIRPGDVISVGQSFGWVSALRARYVVVRDRDGVERLIPNENLITSEVINWSYSDRNVRLKLPVQISYGDDPEQAMALMETAAREHGRVLPQPAPVVRLMEFGDNGITLELRIWVNDPEEGMGNVRSDINLAIWKAFKENHITIPFPQRDLHIIKGDGEG